MYSVRSITRELAVSIVERKHYTRRIGILWEAFGLFSGERLLGVACYGMPSAPINRSSFRDRDFRLYELTRLVVDRDVKNGASFLISHSLRMLRSQPCAVVSYADSAFGHCGIVYQATNWAYTGRVTSHDNLYEINGELVHAMTVIDRYKVTAPGKWAKDNGIKVVKPAPKHRYFIAVGSKADKSRIMSKLAYPIILPYPKSDKTLYDDGEYACSALQLA